jgi:hypothetical protein
MRSLCPIPLATLLCAESWPAALYAAANKIAKT